MMIDLAELTYLIQEGHGDRPALLDVLVRRFAPDVFRLAFDLHAENEDRLEDALGLTAETFRRAISDHRKLSEFDSIRNWLFAVLIRQMNRPGWDTTGARRTVAQPQLALILRYGHELSVDDIAEVVGMHPNAAHRRLRRSRRRAAGLSRPSGRGHIGRSIEDAVDERIAWTEIPGSEHLQTCAECRRFLAELQTFGNDFQTDLAKARPAGMMSGAEEAILDHLAEDGSLENERRRGLPIKEALWAVGAIGAFLLIFQLLNPVLSIDPPDPNPTPTSGPPDPASYDLRPPNYALLEERLAVWEPWTRWEPASAITGAFPSTTGIAFSGDGNYAAFGSFDDVVLWDLFAEVETPLDGHQAVVTALAFGDERWLASGYEDGTVRVWDIIGERIRFVVEDAPRPVTSLAFSPDAGLLAVGGNSGIKIWSFASDKMQEIKHMEGEFVRSLAFSPEGDLLAAVDRSGAVNLWQLPDFKHQLRFAIQQRFNTGIAFSPNGSRIATASMDGSVKVFKITVTDQNRFSASHVFTLWHPTWVSDVTWIGDQLLLAVAGSLESSVSNLGKRGVYFWEMSTGLPAALPLFLDDDGGILNVRQVDHDRLYLGSYNRAVHMLSQDQPNAAQEITQFARTRTDLFPLESALIAAVPPESLAYKLDFQTALEKIGYAQQLGPILAEAIPPATAPHGAAYDDISGIATFAFIRSFALDHDEWVYLRIRRIDEQDPFPLREDWVGQGAQIEQIQFGRFIGERVHGEWQDSLVDGSGPRVFRWTETPLTRFRWTQDGLLFEVVSRSGIGIADSRWTSLFMPIILALVSADEASPLIDYTVVDGDTCSDIADRFGTTVGRLVELNDLTATCVIFAGNTLQVPLPPAFGPMLERDLDCDGVVERLRTIPDPRRPEGSLYIGFTLEDIPSGRDSQVFEYATFWMHAVPLVDVDFFEAPVLFSSTGGCPWYIAITGYGGSGENSGLRIFSWDGVSMELVLHSRGFLFGGFQYLDTRIVFSTRSLDYDLATAACTETLTTYEWRDGDFIELSESITSGVDCFSSGP